MFNPSSSKTPSPSKYRRSFNTPSSSGTLSPAKSSSCSNGFSSPSASSAFDSSFSSSGAFYGPLTRRACRKWASPRRPETPSSCPRGHVGNVHIFVGLSMTLAGRWGAMCHSCPEGKQFFNIANQAPVPQAVKDEIEEIRAEEEEKYYGQLGYSAPAHSEGEVNYDEIHAGPDPEYASGPHVLDETFLHAYTTEGFLEQIRRREQEEKDEALARRLQDEEDRQNFTASDAHIKRESPGGFTKFERLSPPVSQRFGGDISQLAPDIRRAHKRKKRSGLPDEDVDKGKRTATSIKLSSSDTDSVLGPFKKVKAYPPSLQKTKSSSRSERPRRVREKDNRKGMGNVITTTSSSPTESVGVENSIGSLKKNTGNDKEEIIEIESSSSEELVEVDDVHGSQKKAKYNGKSKGKARVIVVDLSSSEEPVDHNIVRSFNNKVKSRPSASHTTASFFDSEVEILDSPTHTPTKRKTSKAAHVPNSHSHNSAQYFTKPASDHEMEDILGPVNTLSKKMMNAQVVMLRHPTTHSAKFLPQTPLKNPRAVQSFSLVQSKDVQSDPIDAEDHDALGADSDSILSTVSLD